LQSQSSRSFFNGGVFTVKNLHDLPRFCDRWSHLYLERGILDQEAGGLVLHACDQHTPVPIDQVGLLMLGPGISISHAAVNRLADNNCLVAWVGENGIRLYAHGRGGTFSARRLLVQARRATHEEERMAVVHRMYAKRFPGTDLAGKTIEQVRGMEGIRVRRAYAEAGKKFKMNWQGRNYNQDDWFATSDVNRALSAGNACLYGVCHSAIVSAGYSPGLGFIHTGKMLSFVYDVADFYKTETTVPLAFELAGQGPRDLERRVRTACQQVFFEARLMERILPDIAEVLDVTDDCGEAAEEMEGRAVTLALGNPSGHIPGQSESEGA
jgi:CRISPR-associated protein Cas1